MLGSPSCCSRVSPVYTLSDMPRLLTIGLFVLACLFVPVRDGTWESAVALPEAESQVSSPAINERAVFGSRKSVEETAPQKAYDLLEHLKRREGIPLPGYVGGQTFQNRERRLPHGRYREYDVDRKIPGRSRGAERLVIEQDTGKAYYTADHYRSFIPLN